MKKTIAALGASVLGLGTVAVVGSPAAAEPAPLEACTDIADQLSSTFTIESDEWFQDCIPQYGLGKVEFTIVPDESNPAEQFPEEFVPLTEFAYEDTGVEVSSTLDLEALTEYMAISAPPTEVFPPIAPVEVYDESATSQTYVAIAVAPIASTGQATAENTPEEVVAACEVNETSIGWVATYSPIDTTFSQTVDGEAWDYTITGASKPTFFFIQESEEGPLVCVTDGENTIEGDLEYGEALYLFALVMPFVVDGPSFAPTSLEQVISEFSSAAAGGLRFSDLSVAALGESGLQTLGVFSRDGITPAPPAPGPAQLPATGADASTLVVPAIIVGGVVLLGGALVTISIIRRRRNDTAA